MRRRSFIVTAFTAVAGVAAFWLQRRFLDTGSEPVNESTLRAFLDTLLPADETPAASQLGIDGEIMAWLSRLSPGRHRRSARLLAALDQHALASTGQAFASLPGDRREPLLRRFLEQDPEQDRAFHLLREAAFERYYARPESWPGLTEYHPPQPSGYPGYSHPPGRESRPHA